MLRLGLGQLLLCLVLALGLLHTALELCFKLGVSYLVSDGSIVRFVNLEHISTLGALNLLHVCKF